MESEVVLEVIRELARSRDQHHAAAIVAAAVHASLFPLTTAVLDGSPSARCLAVVGAALSSGRQAALEPWLRELPALRVVPVAAEQTAAPAAFAEAPSVVTLALVPIRRATELGTLVLMFDTARELSPEECALLEGLAAAAALAIADFAAVDALVVSEDRYRGLVENLEDVVFSIDQSGNFSYVSPSIQKYGFSPEELRGESFTRFIVPEDLPELLESLMATLGGQLKPTFFRAVSKSGSIHHVRTLSRPVLEAGSPVGLPASWWM
jgi:PAS domain S-box-containing protein